MDEQTKDFMKTPGTQIIARSLDVYPAAQKDSKLLWGVNWTAKMATLSPVPPSFSETLLHADGVIDFTTKQTFVQKAPESKKRGMSIDFSGRKQWSGHDGRTLELALLASNSTDRLLDTQFLWLRGETGKSWVKVIDLNDEKQPYEMLSTTNNLLVDLDTGYINAPKGDSDPHVMSGGQ